MHPASSATLLFHLEHVLGIPTGAASLSEDAARWRSLHDEAVADDPNAANYVEMLEREHDRRMDAQIASTTQMGDDLAAELERFLRDQRPDADEGTEG